MKSKRTERTTLGAALREKFKTPQEALRKLGIDESVLDDPRLAFDGAKNMKPTRLQYLLITNTAAALNPLLAKDKKVNYAPLFKGVTTLKTLTKARRAKIVGDAKLLLKGKTVAKDASIEHLASMLDHFEHTQEPKSLDESVSGPQHRAMEAAAHGQSTLGIPASTGKEFADADRGKTFRDAMPAFMKEHGASDEEIASAMDYFGKSAKDEEPENALDEEEEGENVNIEVEEGEDEVELEEGEDAKGEIEEEEAEDEIEEEEGEDRAPPHAKDSAMNGKTKIKPITQDQLDKAIQSAVAAERKNSQALMAAREFVRPYVGDLPMALDSAAKVYRAAAVALEIPDAKTIHPSALPTLIKMQPKAGEHREMAQDSKAVTLDSKAVQSFNERFPGAARIGMA